MKLCRERPNSVSVEVLARPKMIIKALKWLQENNNLYINVDPFKLRSVELSECL